VALVNYTLDINYFHFSSDWIFQTEANGRVEKNATVLCWREKGLCFLLDFFLKKSRALSSPGALVNYILDINYFYFSSDWIFKREANGRDEKNATRLCGWEENNAR
jgi:hypothetical protein